MKTSSYTETTSLKSGSIPLMSVEVEPYALYTFSFEVKCDQAAYAYVDFYNADGEKNYADNYTGTYPASGEFFPQTVLFMARAEAVKAEVGFQVLDHEIDIRNVQVQPVSREQVLAWADELYASLPEVELFRPANFWELLPATRQALQQGKAIHVVALGDSISNDLINGLGHVFVERQYPGSRLWMTHANGPEKDSKNYADPSVLQRLVFRHQPDLLTIAGMSHDPESVGNIVAMAREALPEVEIMYIEVRVNGNPDPEKQARLVQEFKELGASMGFPVMDFTSAFQSCVERSSHPWSWFQRDDEHLNDRGKQLLGRLLAAAFSP